jgi:pilus assembly protein CpaB
MNRRVTVILLLALMISGGATYLVYRALKVRSASAGPPAVQVVLAAHKLEIGMLLKETDLQMGRWQGAVPEGMAIKKDGLIGRGVMAPIYAGEPVMESRLAAAGAGGGLAITIPPGMRAVAVKVNEIVGVAGFVLPGMRVDVLITGVPPGKQGGGENPQVRTILQNIEVLSAGQKYQKDSEGKPVTATVVNLLVSPEQAEVLTLSSNEAKIQLVLRNPLDTNASKPPGTAKSALFGAPPASAAPTRPRAPIASRPTQKAGAVTPVQAIVVPLYQIEVLNGEKRTEAKFPRPTEEKK